MQRDTTGKHILIMVLYVRIRTAALYWWFRGDERLVGSQQKLHAAIKQNEQQEHLQLPAAGM